jgi:acyl-coenzyme A thioesterase PaaI-like protein
MLIPVQPFPDGPSIRSYVSGHAASAERTRVEYFRNSDDNHLFAKVWFGPQTEGPPDSVHGGAIAAVLDEAMGAVCWMNGHPVVGARITINYLHLTPLGFHGQVESWIEHIERRKIFIKSRLCDDAGKVHAEGEALFIELQGELKARLEEARKMKNEELRTKN